MSHPIYCPNPLCQADNPVERRLCQTCGSAIPHRYLWLPDITGMGNTEAGTLLNGRYLVIQPQILLDTKPGQTPLFTERLDDWAIRYAELFTHQNHIPQIYGYLEHNGNLYELLENSAIYPFESTISNGTSLKGRLMPDLATAWPTANLEQQISWLVQIFNLWEPLNHADLLQTLLQPSLIRVDGDFVRFLHLVANQAQYPTIHDFAAVWEDVLSWHQSPFWTDVYQKMIQGQIINSQEILTHLDHAIKVIHLETTGSKPFDFDIATLTNRGPSRTENQDACYPISKSYLKLKSNQQAWLAVCDGIGGHEGGSVASQLAITTIEQSLNNIDLGSCSADDVQVALEKAIFTANDVICERNDRENRQATQRMGTTIVLAYVKQHQLFITHVGDSRAYRVTSTGCHQLTVDDDLASQEAIYGTSFYRAALQYSGTGALTQALGMSESAQLQPTTQRFYLTEHCLFLLCSDGLSDFDLIDRVWATEFKPVLADRTRLLLACERLIKVANEQNGHDNVTVGLLHVIRPEPQVPQPRSTLQTPIVPASRQNTAIERIPKTRVATVRTRSHWLKTSLLSLLVLGIIGGLIFAWWRSRQLLQPDELVPSAVLPSAVLDAETLQKVNQILQVKPGPVPLSLLPKPDPNRQQVPIKIGDLLPGTIVQVKSQLTTETQENWVMLKVCSVPSESPPGPAAALVAGTEGWQTLKQIAQQVTLPSALPAEQLGDCAPPQLESTPARPLPDRSATDLPTALPTAPNQAQ